MATLKDFEKRIDKIIEDDAHDLAEILDSYRASNTWVDHYPTWDDALNRAREIRLEAMDKHSEQIEKDAEILYGLKIINRTIIDRAIQIHSTPRN